MYIPFYSCVHIGFFYIDVCLFWDFHILGPEPIHRGARHFEMMRAEISCFLKSHEKKLKCSSKQELYLKAAASAADH